MRLVAGLAVAAIALLSSRMSAHSAGAALCDAYAKESAAKAQGVRDFACGYDLKDPRWTTNRKGHASWCRATPEKAVADETARRRGDMNLCQTCRAYADMAVEAAAENKKNKCRLTGPAWTENKSDHFAWCMALRDNENAAGPDIAATYQTIATKIQTVIRQETVKRKIQIVQCQIVTRREARP